MGIHVERSQVCVVDISHGDVCRHVSEEKKREGKYSYCRNYLTLNLSQSLENNFNPTSPLTQFSRDPFCCESNALKKGPTSSSFCSHFWRQQRVQEEATLTDGRAAGGAEEFD